MYSGKTTYCNGIKMFMETIGRNSIIINLDFANDVLPYVPAVNVCDLISVEVRKYILWKLLFDI